MDAYDDLRKFVQDARRTAVQIETLLWQVNHLEEQAQKEPDYSEDYSVAVLKRPPQPDAVKECAHRVIRTAGGFLGGNSRSWHEGDTERCYHRGTELRLTWVALSAATPESGSK